MFTFVQKRRWFFLISAAFIIPGLVIMLYSLVTTGSLFRLSNDFLGGSIYELQFTESGIDETVLRQVFTDFGNTDLTIQQVGAVEDDRWSVRTGFQDAGTTDAIINRLDEIASLDRDRLFSESVSATVGQEVTRSAVLAVTIAAVIVTGFIVLAFRQVPDAFRYGVCAIIAMIHDVLIVCGLVSLMGLIAGWEVDALFLTAVLTIVGFSIQDTIVMFDRIRENIPKYLGEPYEVIVNRSILETLHRSLATQLNAFFVMAAILLFGGDSIKQFIATLFIGLISGTYSSIAIAVPLLVAWEKGEIPFLKPKHLQSAAAAEG
ncbi:MAG: protein translocase subunit SecF [Anaerolineae bacterium]|nr:protein translocase subunit SecF [Anaerolineae bacterium]NUQ02765.1 protein translocase subunit SecF [Anaerolineae bacterium]